MEKNLSTLKEDLRIIEFNTQQGVIKRTVITPMLDMASMVSYDMSGNVSCSVKGYLVTIVVSCDYDYDDTLLGAWKNILGASSYYVNVDRGSLRINYNILKNES